MSRWTGAWGLVLLAGCVASGGGDAPALSSARLGDSDEGEELICVRGSFDPDGTPSTDLGSCETDDSADEDDDDSEIEAAPLELDGSECDFDEEDFDPNGTWTDADDEDDDATYEYDTGEDDDDADDEDDYADLAAFAEQNGAK